ncbi:alanine--tRNA ligase [Methanocrinis sp.]|uniref:alanine--tRNA ligase n=1 Tax=Methanocrinis sp. TaxID=3101522 RepID=UPI003D14A591
MFPEDAYNLDFFKEEGFIRKTCEKCGGRFWTRDPARTTCGDPPCDPYTFIGSPVFKREIELDEMREHYLSFFEEKGHTRIKRYPVIARWRDDIYLTIASIADFQPFITSGLVPPPANPLTVSQPCIRLDDLDSVGRSGRHLTTFEMMAHHVFNTPEREIYWKERTVALCDELLLGLGADPLAVTYKESPWAGGGNAGPSVEVMMGGLELATLVFMDMKLSPRGEYEIKGERYSKMENYIVDTGYGLERFVWASKGSPTIYDAIFPEVVAHISELAGLDSSVSDEERARILAANARLAGMVDLEDASLRELRARIASDIGISAEELDEIITPIERIYAVSDHTRCLAYMLGDGIIPSNVKAGYLARLVIRRTLRQMKDLSIEVPLSELVSMQLSRLDYADLAERLGTIVEILDQEEGRYAETLDKGRRLVKRIAEGYGKRGEKIPLSEMISLYDSHGIPPEIAKDAASEAGVEVDLPDNFYSRVASTHIKSEKEEREGVTIDFPETRRIFYERPFERKFSARVLEVVDGNVILDQTLFYPEGGGQPGDHGLIRKGSKAFRVVDVTSAGAVVLHRIAEEESAEAAAEIVPGDSIEGEIDMTRRLAHARHHTAAHIIHDSAKKVLGSHIWQAGAQKSEDRARLDISHHKRISREELKEIELLANRTVMENVPISTGWLDRSEAEKRFGFELYQGGVPPGKSIRVVQVGTDVEACAGTHCANTGMVGPIKVLRTERVQDGVERIEFAAGEAAVLRGQERDDLLFGASEILSVPPEQLPKTATRFFEEWKDLRKETARLKEDLARAQMEGLTSKAVEVGGLKAIVEIVENADVEELIKAASMISGKDYVAILGSEKGGAKIVAAVGKTGLAKGLKAGEIVRAATKVVGGGGGGKPEIAQGGGPRAEKLSEALGAGLARVRASSNSSRA